MSGGFYPFVFGSAGGGIFFCPFSWLLRPLHANRAYFGGCPGHLLRACVISLVAKGKKGKGNKRLEKREKTNLRPPIS